MNKKGDRIIAGKKVKWRCSVDSSYYSLNQYRLKLGLYFKQEKRSELVNPGSSQSLTQTQLSTLITNEISDSSQQPSHAAAAAASILTLCRKREREREREKLEEKQKKRRRRRTQADEIFRTVKAGEIKKKEHSSIDGDRCCILGGIFCDPRPPLPPPLYYFPTGDRRNNKWIWKLIGQARKIDHSQSKIIYFSGQEIGFAHSFLHAHH